MSAVAVPLLCRRGAKLPPLRTYLNRLTDDYLSYGPRRAALTPDDGSVGRLRLMSVIVAVLLLCSFTPKPVCCVA
jgi:hypothetical protein